MEDKIRILIADDFQILREDLRDCINRQPDMAVVGEAASGKEIVALAGTTDFDLILMDIEMESMNAGIIATEEIREKNEDAKIIFLTVHETKEMIVTAMGTGAQDYVVKGQEEEILYHIRCTYEGNPVMQRNIQETIMNEYKRLQKSEQSLLYFINIVSKLTMAERELIKLLLNGHRVCDIAEIRFVEKSTVKTQIKSLLRKCGCGRTKELVRMIQDLNIEHLF